ncbi:MAG TPA: hypothetical protein DEQ28_04525 [Clostridiales bacterium]|nr:hypothetical protein [Clostridiales bacterium]
MLSPAPGSRYTELSGMSMACPHVSGAAALVWSATPGLPARQVRCLLADTAEDPGMNHDLQGRGLVRAGRAVEEARKQSPNRRPQVSSAHPVWRQSRGGFRTRPCPSGVMAPSGARTRRHVRRAAATCGTTPVPCGNRLPRRPRRTGFQPRSPPASLRCARGR